VNLRRKLAIMEEQGLIESHVDPTGTRRWTIKEKGRAFLTALGDLRGGRDT